MDSKIKKAIIEYQCPGCIVGNGPEECFKQSEFSVSCDNHRAGTAIMGIGKIFLGLPSGFNRLGSDLGGGENMKIEMFKSFESANKNHLWKYNKYNIPVWKYLNNNGHTLVRGLIPRLNLPFLHIYLEDCRGQIDCFEVDQEMVDYMD